MSGPLEGYRVVEFAEAVAGPYCAMELGDGGADVIKVEGLDGDRTRQWGSDDRGDMGAVFGSLNRSKRGIALDLGGEPARELTARLLRWADVAVIDAGRHEETILAGGSPADTAPGLIACVISEFGDRGPWAGRAPYGELAAQLAGEATASLGRLGEEPVRVGTDIASMYAAIYAVQAICAALLERERSGLGQRIDVSLFGSVLAMRSTLWVAMSNPDSWSGYHLGSYAQPPDYGHQCKDGAILFSLARITPEARESLIGDLEMEWVKDDPRYGDFLQDRGGPTSDVAEIMQPVWERAFSKFTMDEVIERVRRNGGWAFPTNNYQQLVDLDQARHVGLVQTVDGPGGTPIQTLLPPWDFSETPVELERPAPTLGQHTREILAELGYGSREATTLLDERVVIG